MIKIKDELLHFQRPSPHSRFSPSASERWSEDACPFSVKYCENIPQEENKYAAEGSIAHSIAEQYFYSWVKQEPMQPEWVMQLVTETNDDGEEMLAGAEQYRAMLEYYLTNKELVGDILYYGLERGVPIFPEEGAFGTGDLVIIGTKATIIGDYKYGRKPVHADCFQLRSYLAGARRYLDNIPADYKFVAVIVQPRTDFTSKVHEYTLSEMDETLVKIYSSIQASKRKDLVPVKGNWCHFCPANQTRNPDLQCPLVKNRYQEALDSDFDKMLADFHAPVETFNGENIKRDQAMMKLIAIAPLINTLAKHAQSEFEYRLTEKKEEISGVRIQEKIGNRRWAAGEAETVEALKGLFPGVSAMVQPAPKLKTFTQIEKEVGKGKIDSLLIRPISKVVALETEKEKEILAELATLSGLAISND